MQLLLTTGFIFLIVLWGIFSPASMAALFDLLLASITRNFGRFYLCRSRTSPPHRRA